jgi:regulator of sirC expression with transglutaminase-like and TPR domain
MEHQGERAILDPFDGGRQYDAGDLRDLLRTMNGDDAALTPAHYAPVSDREVLLRLQNNIKLRLMQLREPVLAAAAADSMLLFAPAVRNLWRDAGLLHAQAGNLDAAVEALESYLERETGETARRETAKLLQQLRRGLS